jgi:hypothetical protein
LLHPLQSAAGIGIPQGAVSLDSGERSGNHEQHHLDSRRGRHRAGRVVVLRAALREGTMEPSDDKPKGDAPEQRDALERSEKAANRDQPRNWKDDALDDKVVEVPPIESETPMRGLDPEREREGRTDAPAGGAGERNRDIERE